MEAARAQELGKRNGIFGGSISDIVLAALVVAIIALMILPLPLWVMDMLVAVNILVGVSLLLLAIYIPAATAFSSFPSVILLSTLFRLAISIATTRLILLEADAGEIIQTFGEMAVGGNLVVGFVVFIIITVVQFIVIAKGAERVAEVSARFTLDAMPGKQLSIDSDLRSGLLTKEDAKAKRKLLELESQLHGALDGAMKFVKGDTIAGIVILIINIIGGLAVGVMQRDMALGDAVQTYSILTIGDGLVAQIPALLTSISAGLIITRNANDGMDSHLGTSITSQVTNYPRVISIGGIMALLFMFIPGFPWPIFLMLGLFLLGYSLWRHTPTFLQGVIPQRSMSEADAADTEEMGEAGVIRPPKALELKVGPRVLAHYSLADLHFDVGQRLAHLRVKFGVPIPDMHLSEFEGAPGYDYLLLLHGDLIAQGVMVTEQVFVQGMERVSFVESSKVAQPVLLPALNGSWAAVSQADSVASLKGVPLLVWHVEQALCQQLSQFIGIQETANLVNQWHADYPDLIKEMLRAVAPQTLAEVLRNLLRERVSIRNLRAIFEALTEIGAQENNVVILSERLRVGLKNQISQQYAGDGAPLQALVCHPDLEETIRRSMREGNGGLDPDFYQRLLSNISAAIQSVESGTTPVILCAFDVRRQLRQLTEERFGAVPVLSYQELSGDVQVVPLVQLGQQ